MRLTWSHQMEIAAALTKAYPDMDRLSLGHEALLKLIRALPAFDDAPQPPSARYLDHILWTWMRLADETTDTERQAS